MTSLKQVLALRSTYSVLALLGASLCGIGRPLTVRASGRQLVALGMLPRADATRISFCGPTDGWAFSTDSIWATKDGGVSWRKLPIRDSLYNEGPIIRDIDVTQPRYFSRDTCAQAWIQRGTGILRTQDAGRTWTIQGSLPIGDPTRWNIFSLSFGPDAESGWASGPSVQTNPNGDTLTEQTIFRTGDGGVFWNSQRVPSGDEHIIVDAVSATQAVAAGRGRIYRTVNGGNTWVVAAVLSSDLKSGPCWNPAHFYFQDSLHGWLGYEDGCVMQTTDGGQHWRLLARVGDIWSGIAGLSDTGTLFFDSGPVGWILGQDCQIHETQDGGASWQSVASAERIYGFYCRSFPGSGMRCWATGSRLWELR